MQNQQEFLDISKTESIECHHCGGLFFNQAVLLRVVSKFYTQTGKDEPLPIPVFICQSCNTPLKKFFPNIADVNEKLGYTPKVQIHS